VYQPTQYKTHSSIHTPNSLIVAAGYPIKKKNKKKHCLWVRDRG